MLCLFWPNVAIRVLRSLFDSSWTPHPTLSEEERRRDMQLRRIFRRFARRERATSDLHRHHDLEKRNVVTIFLSWRYMRAVFHRGYVLTSSLYFVVTAHLSASQIVLLGTAMSVTLVVLNIPTGI